MVFNTLALQAPYALWDGATESQIKERFSFRRFPGLVPGGQILQRESQFFARLPRIKRHHDGP